ncbi:glycerol-3-phosphate 1-O-acyltransferase PlsY [Erysipelothrix sp. HDW6A]|uniref:glycerol-3-phosphate 1-O-acyltransferase PlsY n=1 Tax=Erysipelothrix sp. HDW6A TaxID=2714928 RepID=UPI00140771E5|nr:glycerol-3-phosphate 1-O-acyltransferase PlsY [Erysipelothrix sp. HDW6A]QIK57456.1 glycerol-3-phosphate 1-O-acyltransferase PlsY [Erysipelothrix sp. HDW6A]
MNIFIASVLGYLFGSIPSALIIGKVFYKVDIREHGSGNLGGTNAGRTLGSKAGVIVIAMDALKGTIAMLIASLFDPSTVIYAGFFATIGHCFPIFAKFKGGKAVATAVGYLLGTSLLVTKQPLLHLVLPVAIFLVLLYFTKMVSLASIIAIPSAAVIMLFTQSDMKVTIATAIIAAIVVVRHRKNIERILNKTERKITWM